MGVFDGASHGNPAWEIGRARSEFVALEESGGVSGDVLDEGCVTGENALILPGRGHDVRAMDPAPQRSEGARSWSRERDLSAALCQGGTCKLAFGELEQGCQGPRPPTRGRNSGCFPDGEWTSEIQPAVFEGRTWPAGSRAWLSLVPRV